MACKKLVTYQTDAEGQPVSKILVESCTDIDQELSSVRSWIVLRRVVFMASTEGGVEIKKSQRNPEKILKASIDPLTGAQAYQGRDLAFRLGLRVQIKQFTQLFMGLAALFQELDLALLEINPLVITSEGNLHCWMAVASTATLYRQPNSRPCMTLLRRTSGKLRLPSGS